MIKRSVVIVVIIATVLLVPAFVQTQEASAQSSGPIFVWMFGYVGDVFYPQAQLGLSQHQLINTAHALSNDFGKSNLEIVTAVSQIPGQNIQASYIPQIRSYVDALRKSATVVYGRIDLDEFNLTTSETVYDEVAMYVNQLEINGIWFDHPALLF